MKKRMYPCVPLKRIDLLIDRTDFTSPLAPVNFIESPSGKVIDAAPSDPVRAIEISPAGRITSTALFSAAAIIASNVSLSMVVPVSS